MGEKKLLEMILSNNADLQIERFGLSTVSPKWNLIDRKIPEHYLTFIVGAQNHVVLDNSSWILGPGSITYVSPFFPHSMRSVSSLDPHTFYHLRFTLSGPQSNSLSEISWAVLKNGQALQPLVDQMFNEYCNPGLFWQIRFKSLLVAVLAEVFRSGKSNCSNEINLLNSGLLAECRNYVLDNIKRTIQPSELSDLCGYNSDYFTRIFKKTTGAAPRTWIMRERMRQAAFLLQESDLTVGEVAYLTGCDDVFRFSRQFKKIFGIPPTVFRRQ